ncbi:MAG: hypothetical protein AcusKO_14000 [Acuticoccus sp.]
MSAVRPIAFAVPGDLATPTGGYRYDRAVMAELAALGHDVRHVPLGASFPFATDADIADAAAALAGVPDDTALIVDGLAFSALPAAVLDKVTAPMVALVHHPLSLETGLAADDAARLALSERAALAFAREVVVTSPTTARIVAADFGVSPARLHVALPGLEPLWRTLRRRPATPPRIVAVGSLSPRKGHDVLVDALATLTDHAWHCDIVGGAQADSPTAAALRAQIARLGLSQRITLNGPQPIETIATLFEEASLFALATRYEGFGMVFAEAMAAGLPVVGTTGGAVPDVVPPSAGVLVAPDDAPAFAAALGTLLADDAARRRLADGARTAAATLGGWDAAAAVFSRLAERLG